MYCYKVLQYLRWATSRSHNKLEFLKMVQDFGNLKTFFFWVKFIFLPNILEFCNNLLLLLIKKIPVKSFLFVHTTLFEVVNWSFNSHPRENSIFSNLISIWQFRKKRLKKKKTWFSKVGYKTIYKDMLSIW